MIVAAMLLCLAVFRTAMLLGVVVFVCFVCLFLFVCFSACFSVGVPNRAP